MNCTHDAKGIYTVGGLVLRAEGHTIPQWRVCPRDRVSRALQQEVGTFACAIIESKKYSGDEASPGIAAMSVEGDIAQGSPICCAGHCIC